MDDGFDVVVLGRDEERQSATPSTLIASGFRRNCSGLRFSRPEL